MLVLNKNVKTIFTKILLMMILFLNFLGIKSFAIVRQTQEFYVNDSANLLSEDVKKYIMQTNQSLNSQTGAQIVVVTVKNLEGKEIEEYATELFRAYGIGDRTKNNGVLLLLALQERKFRIEVGYGLEGTLTDGKTGRIQDEYIIPYLKNDNWNEGVRNGYSKVLEEVAKEYNVNVGQINAVKQGVASGLFETTMMLISLIVASFVLYKLTTKGRIIVLVTDIISMVCSKMFLPYNISLSLLSFQIILIFLSIFSILSIFWDKKHRGGGSSSGRGRKFR